MSEEGFRLLTLVKLALNVRSFFQIPSFVMKKYFSQTLLVYVTSVKQWG